MTQVIHLYDENGQRVWSGRVEHLADLEEQVKHDNRVQEVPPEIQAAINAKYGTPEQRQTKAAAARTAIDALATVQFDQVEADIDKASDLTALKAILHNVVENQKYIANALLRDA